MSKSLLTSTRVTIHGAPLTDLLGTDSLTEFGEQLLQGTANLDVLQVSRHTKLLLNQHRRKYPKYKSTHLPLRFEELMQGIWKWPERTSTSPSGRHLGTYKSLLKDFPPPKQKDKPDKQTEQPDDDARPYGINVMEAIFQMLCMAVKHTHTFDRWKIIWNLFLEKIPGTPYVNKLRALHIVEADYNLLLKWNSSLGFMRRAEDNLQLTDSQGGGRKGHSAIDLAVKKVVTYDYIRINKEEAINIELDAEACFDMMVELCQNLACLSHGADPLYIRLHAKTQRAQRYYIKHAYGISEVYNTHSDTNPWYGAGQGTGDACPRWIVQSDNLIGAYKTQVKPWIMNHPTGLPALEQAIDAFIDDTTLIIGGRPPSIRMTLTQTAQENLLHWHHLLRASGGRLNPQKCSMSSFQWNYDEDGTATIQPPQQKPTQQLTIPDKNDKTYTLTQNRPDEAVRLLGVQIAMDGNYKVELGLFVQRNNRYVQALQQCNLTNREAGIVYKQCYLPMVSYPLPATNIPPDLLHRHQAKATTVFLAKMGYRRTMPRAVVYAPKALGGIGFLHLGYEQGVQQTMQMIKHLRARTTNGALFNLAINTYQLHSGLSHPILEDTRPCLWIPTGWTSSLRQFLHTTHSQIVLELPWMQPSRRFKDKFLMDDISKLQLTQREFQLIQNV